MTTADRAPTWAPIAVFAYNRPAMLAALMNSLRNCDGFALSPVTIFVDGPRSDADRGGVEAVKRFVEGLDLPNVTWVFQDINRGLRNSIYAGVTEVVRQHGRVIVFEDDLVLSPIALRYFNGALNRYQNDDRVFNISGFIYDVPSLRTGRSTLTLPFAHPWGWATWERAWNAFELDARPTPEQLRSASFRSFFDVHGLHPYSTSLKSSIDGLVNSWFIHWYYTIFRYRGVSIFPPRRVLNNVGTNEGTHGGRLNPYKVLVPKPKLLADLPEFGDSANVDYVALDNLKSCWEARVRRFIARAGLMKRILLR